jgi:hypothetical protein
METNGVHVGDAESVVKRGNDYIALKRGARDERTRESGGHF